VRASKFIANNVAVSAQRLARRRRIFTVVRFAYVTLMLNECTTVIVLAPQEERQDARARKRSNVHMS